MRQSLRDFIKDDRAAVTTEFVVLFPFPMFVLVTFTDISILYLTRTEMFSVSRDTARLVSVGALHVDDADEYIQSKIKLSQRTYTAAAYSGSVVIIEMSVNVGDASVFGVLRPIVGRTLVTRVEMLREATPPPPSGGGSV